LCDRDGYQHSGKRAATDCGPEERDANPDLDAVAAQLGLGEDRDVARDGGHLVLDGAGQFPNGSVRHADYPLQCGTPPRRGSTIP
jgi:hypothetical protein